MRRSSGPFAAATLLLVLAAGCGAGDADAPLVTPRPSCPTLDEAAATWLVDVDAGAYAGTARLLREVVPQDAVRTLVGAALRALGPSGVDAPSQVLTVLRASEGASWTRQLDGLAAAIESPQAEAAALALRTAGHGCTTPTQLTTLADLLDDPRARSGVAALLGGEPEAIAKAFAGLGVTSRKGAQTLLGLILDSAARPDFDPDALRSTLSDARPAAGSAAGTLDALIAVLDGATRDADGQLDPARISASSSLIACIRDADPDDGLLALLTWVLMPPPPQAGLPTASTPTTSDPDQPRQGASNAVFDGAFDAIVSLLRVFAAEPTTVAALRSLIDAVATVDALRTVTPELQHLVSSGALPALADALDLALHASCTGLP